MNTLNPKRYPDEPYELYKARRQVANNYKPPVTYVHQHELTTNEQGQSFLTMSTYVKPKEK